MTGPEETARDVNDSANSPSPSSELNNVGVLLRADRLRRGQDLIDVSKILRIQFSYLSAIEQGKYDDLPKGPYALGFVRTYADYLGLDADEIVRRFKQEFQEATTRSDLVFPTPEQETSIPSGAVVVVSVALALAAYGGWYYTQTQDRSVAELVEPVPERLVELATDDSRAAPQPVVVAQPLQELATLSVEEPIAEQPAPVAPEEEVITASEVAAEAVEVVPETPEEPVIETSVEVETSNPVTEIVAEAVVAEATPEAPVVAEVADAPTAPDAAVVDDDVVETAAPATEVPAIDPVETAIAEPEVVEVIETESAQASAVETPVTEVASVDVDSDLSQEPVVELTEEAAVDTVAAELAAIPAAPDLSSASPAIEGGDVSDVTSATNGSSRIIIRATDRSWVRVLGADDRVLLTRMLMPGDVYEAPNEPELSLEAGNAGALEIEVDGTKLPPIGDFGEVVANFPLKPDEMLAEVQ